MGWNPFERKTKVKEVNLLNPTQEDVMTTIAGHYKPQVGKYDKYDSQLDTLMSLKPSTTINKATTDNYVKNTIANPMRKTLQTQVLPQVNASMGRGYWSTARNTATQKAVQDTEDQIASLSADAAYKDEQARRDLSESAYNRGIQAQGLRSQLDPSNILMQLLGVKTKEAIGSQQASPWDILTQGLTAGGALYGAAK